MNENIDTLRLVVMLLLPIMTGFPKYSEPMITFCHICHSAMESKVFVLMKGSEDAMTLQFVCTNIS